MWKGLRVMLVKILKKDFRRKKLMNIILFIFLVTAGTLVSSSTNLLLSTISAIDYFIEESDVADLIAVTNSDDEMITTITDWASDYQMVSSFLAEDGIILAEKNINAIDDKRIENANSMVLVKMPKTYNRIFDGDSGEEFILEADQVAVPVSIQKKMNLVLGDTLIIGVSDKNGEEYSREFTVSHIFKDVVYGSEMMGMKRIIVNDKDFNGFMQQTNQNDRIKMWGFTKAEGVDYAAILNSFSSLSLPTLGLFAKNIIGTLYILDMVIAATMILFSIFLILISFLLLRFTIVFTIMEDYKQIGVMKAIGLHNKDIRGMYSIKYLLLSIISGGLGFLASIPISGIMKKTISEYILLKQTPVSWIAAFISIILVVGIIMLFCNYSTGKIKKVSAIDAIRQGNTGERFKNTGKLKLHKHKRVCIPIFLALNDIKSDFKKYLILIITFILGTVLIIIPSNVVSTLSGKDTIELFGFVKSDFYIRDVYLGNQEEARRLINEAEKEINDLGFTVDIHADLISNGKIMTFDQAKSTELLTFQGLEVSTEEYDYIEGMAPKLDNEIAVTEKAAEILKVEIGDKVLCKIQNETREYIITALFQTMNNMGMGVRVPEGYSALEGVSTTIQLSGNFINANEDIEELVNELKSALPGRDIKNSVEVTASFIGNITKQIDSVKKLILIIVLGINFLITALLLKMFLSKEIPEIAILKSLGFDNIYIRLWQIARIGIVLVFSILTGTILANSTGNLITSGIFRIVGISRLKMSIEPLMVYFIYPAMLFIITMLAVLSGLGIVRRTHVWELNNQE